jgi:5-(carboxyamino)imidazole ribonucleotide mutase
MVASLTTLPVIGVPIKSRNSIDGWDSLLSIVQMPEGVPVATVAINGAKNAGLLAVRILAAHHEPQLAARLDNYRRSLSDKVHEGIAVLKQQHANTFDH